MHCLAAASMIDQLKNDLGVEIIQCNLGFKYESKKVRRWDLN
jgi:hypothetical protein